MRRAPLSLIALSVFSAAVALAQATGPATALPEKLPPKKPVAASAPVAKSPSASAKKSIRSKKVRAGKAPSKSAPKSAPKTEDGKAIATTLPAFKGKKRTAVTSSNVRSSDDSQDGVVIRAMTTAEYTKYAAKMAEEEKQNATAQPSQTIQAKRIAAPRPVETLQVTAAEQDNSPDFGEAPRPKIVEPPVAEPRIEGFAKDKVEDVLTEPVVAAAVAPVRPVVMPVVIPVARPVVVAPVVTPAPLAPRVAEKQIEIPAPASAPEQTKLVESEPEIVAEPAPVTIAPTSAYLAPAVVAPIAPAVPIVPVAPETPFPKAEPVATPPERQKTESVYEAHASADADRETSNKTSNENRVSVSTSYLAAHYSQIESQLEDGATTIGFDYAHNFGAVEGSGGIEFVHGLDQSVSPGNARMILLRGDAAYFFSKGRFQPFISGGLAVAKVNVQSYRLQSDGSTVLRDHDTTTAFGVTPAAGMRFLLTSRFDLQVQLEELAFLAGSDAGALGGLSAGGSIGLHF